MHSGDGLFHAVSTIILWRTPKGPLPAEQICAIILRRNLQTVCLTFLQQKIRLDCAGYFVLWSPTSSVYTCRKKIVWISLHATLGRRDSGMFLKFVNFSISSRSSSCFILILPTKLCWVDLFFSTKNKKSLCEIFFYEIYVFLSIFTSISITNMHKKSLDTGNRRNY